MLMTVIQISIATEFCKRFGLFVINKSIQLGLFGFLKQVFKKEGYVQTSDPCFLCREGSQKLLVHLE